MAEFPENPVEDETRALRLDRFLWQARFLRTRSLATRFVLAGKVRINTRKITRPSALVRIGDVLTFPLGKGVRVIRVLALPERRGPASEARMLYEDVSPNPGQDEPH